MFPPMKLSTTDESVATMIVPSSPRHIQAQAHGKIRPTIAVDDAELLAAPMMPCLDESSDDGFIGNAPVRLAPRFDPPRSPLRYSEDFFGMNNDERQHLSTPTVDPDAIGAWRSAVVTQSYPVLICRSSSDDPEFYHIQTITALDKGPCVPSNGLLVRNWLDGADEQQRKQHEYGVPILCVRQNKLAGSVVPTNVI